MAPGSQPRARTRADRVVTAIESNLALQSFAEGEWRPPILKTEASTGRGVPELWHAIQQFRTYTADSRERRVKARGEFRLRELLTHAILDHVEKHVLAAGEFEQILESIAARKIDPYSAAADILRRTLK